MTSLEARPGATRSAGVDERASLLNGADFLATRAVGDVPAMVLVDGPAGVRMQDVTRGADHLGLRPSVPATAFPLPVALAQSWDAELVHRVGVALGTEAAAAGVGVLLGPGINLRRDPRAGRNFEYWSEDPRLTGTLAVAYVAGLQSQGVGASLKHFAANNTETERFRSSSDVDPRPLRELYLRAFQQVVEEARPWTVMCAYNKINGVPAAENRWLLTDVLRDEWGFDGVVVSDWGAVDDRVASLRAGVDLAMPADDGRHDRDVLGALADGSLAPGTISTSADRVERLARRVQGRATPGRRWDRDEHHLLARDIAARCVVLLKNDGAVLPLDVDRRIAVIGEFAVRPRFQGGGSSRVNATRLDIPLDELVALAPGADITFALGFDTAAVEDARTLAAEAVQVAASADVAVLFLGVATSQETEGFDRESIDLPPDQLELLRAVHATCPNTVVVLSHGGVLRLAPVLPHARAILDAALLGQAGGGAIADLLLGRVDPTARLTETVPERIEDAPSFGAFPGEELHVRYGEGMLMGYRGYDARGTAVTFPFGHGLSYTSFEHTDLALRSDGEGGITASVRITNTGSRAGTEVVQAYTSLPSSAITRPPRELRAFAPIRLEPHETRRVSLSIPRTALAHWSVTHDGWKVEGGIYRVEIGASSRDIRLIGSIGIDGDDDREPLTLASSVAEVLQDPVAGAVLRPITNGMFDRMRSSEAASTGFDIERMIGSTPIGRFAGSLGGHLRREDVAELLARANAERGLTAP